MEYLFIYLLQLADMVDCICLTLLVAIVLLAFVAFVIISSSGYSIEDIFSVDRDGRCEAVIGILAGIKMAIIVCGVLAMMVNFLPNKQTMLLMGGTYLGKRVATTVVDGGKFEKINTIIDLQLDKYIKELGQGGK